MNDMTLLQEYVESRSEKAFEEIVNRYVDLVYSICMRELHDQHLAQETAQAVFFILSRKAGKLRNKGVLAGWLVQTDKYASENARTVEMRRKKHEMEAAKNETE